MFAFINLSLLELSLSRLKTPTSTLGGVPNLIMIFLGEWSEEGAYQVLIIFDVALLLELLDNMAYNISFTV